MKAIAPLTPPPWLRHAIRDGQLKVTRRPISRTLNSDGPHGKVLKVIDEEKLECLDKYTPLSMLYQKIRSLTTLL